MSSPEEMLQTMINNLPEKTGKSLEQWLAITAPSAFQKHGELVKWLKIEYGITHGFANLIAAKTKEQREGATPSEDLVALQYSKGKEALKPIYFALVEAIQKFGSDVELAPKKAYVSIRRNKQFALIQPSTKTRVDVGIVLKQAPNDERLEKAGSFNAMVTHRVRLTSIDDIDSALIDWLKQAYQEA